MIRVILPPQLRTLAQAGKEVTLDVAAPVTRQAVLDALEARYPVLTGTLRDPATRRRRPRVRFFAGREDLSLTASDAPLPAAVASGAEALLIVGAISGG